MSKEIKKVVPSNSKRFADKIINEFAAITPQISEGLGDFQRRLCQNYFIKLDMQLKKLEQARMAKSERYRDSTPVIWDNINMNELALNVVTYAKVGLDPLQDNHVSFVPFKNKKTNQYDIGFIIGYRGLELKAKKYGLDIPDDVIIEVVYSNDEFIEHKKGYNTPIETYEFKVKNSFDRGEIVGGFYYYIYVDKPEKNKLVVMSKKDIEKRKPKHASAEFWGGEKDVWEDGKKVGKKEVEGWYDEMVYKTIYRAAYNNITIDSKKIDDEFIRIITTVEVVDENPPNSKMLETPDMKVINEEQEPDPEPEPNESDEASNQIPNEGPGF
jgi:recombination protein RecT